MGREKGVTCAVLFYLCNQWPERRATVKEINEVKEPECVNCFGQFKENDTSLSHTKVSETFSCGNDN